MRTHSNDRKHDPMIRNGVGGVVLVIGRGSRGGWAALRRRSVYTPRAPPPDRYSPPNNTPGHTSMSLLAAETTVTGAASADGGARPHSDR